jgi:predicted dehydrogenase
MPTPFGIACLGITHPHVSVRLDVARRIDGIRLVGVSDPDPANQERLRALSSFVEAPVLTRNEVLASADVHGVIVEPWTYEMVDYAIACLEADKSVLVEKPGGSNPADLERLVRASAKAKGAVQVGYNFRFSPMIDFAKRLVDEGVLGKIVQSRAHAAGPAGDATHRWFNLPNDLGGCFWEDGCHVMDLILHLFGMPRRVTAQISKFGTVSGADSLEDAAVAALEYDQMLLSFDFTAWEANGWLETWELSLFGTEGTLHVQMLPERYALYLKRDRAEFKKGWTRWNETTFAVPWSGEPTPWEAWHIVANKSFFFRELAAFRDAATGTRASVIPPSHARNVATVMAACYESSREGGQRVAIES